MSKAIPEPTTAVNEAALKATLNLTFHNDPGHSWLEVPHCLIEELGIGEKISQFSYIDERYVYLEEDRDATMFINAMLARNLNFSVTEKHSDCDSPVRNMDRFALQALNVPKGLIQVQVWADMNVADEQGDLKIASGDFQWTVMADQMILEIIQRLKDEVARSGQYGWMQGKTFFACYLTRVVHCTEDGRFLDLAFPKVILDI